jgi:3-mercaptopyruvate sulfurtransferase SseA
MVGLLARTVVLLVIGAAVGLGGNAVRKDGISLRSYSPPASCEGAKGGPLVQVLPPGQAVRLCGDSGVMVADARPPQRFAEGHVADAVHLPCAAPNADASAVVARLAHKHTLIVYGDTTEEARPVAEDLRRRVGRGDLRIVVLEGGFPAWSKAGLACSSGPCPECTEHR